MWKKILLGVLGLALLAGGVMVYRIGPRNVIGILRYGTRREGDLQVGMKPPDVELLGLDGAPVHLASRVGSKPTVFIFGSFT